MESDKIIRMITLGADWQEALSMIVVEQGMDASNIDIIKLTDSFLVYLKKLEDFDFRIPARFILIASILLSMKCEKLLEKEEERLKELEGKEIKKLDLTAPMLSPPVKRTAKRKVTLTDLIAAMNKSLQIKKRKEKKVLEHKPMIAAMPLEKKEDSEKVIKKVYKKRIKHGRIDFSDLVVVWKRKNIVKNFMPMLYLAQRGKINCEQQELFKEIHISLK